MRRKPISKTPGQRQLRVGERIRHLLSDILRHAHLGDPDLAQPELITVTDVNVSPDLKNATAYVIPLGTTTSGKDPQKVVEALNRAANYFRRELAGELGMRHTPKIGFKFDNSFDNALHIDGLLNNERVRRDVEAKDDDEEE